MSHKSKCHASTLLEYILFEHIKNAGSPYVYKKARFVHHTDFK